MLEEKRGFSVKAVSEPSLLKRKRKKENY